MSRSNLPRPYYEETSLSSHHLAFDSPTHSATQRLALSIPFFLSVFLTHAKSQIHPVKHWEQLSEQQLIASSQEKDWTNERYTKSNQSCFSANSWLQRKLPQRGGKKERQDSEQLLEKMFLSHFSLISFQLKPTTFKTGVDRTERIAGYRQTILQMPFDKQTDSAVWKLSPYFNRNAGKRSKTLQTTALQAQSGSKCQRTVRVTSTYPKSSREYMSLEKTVQSLSERWKEVWRKEIMEERGKCQPERKERYTCWSKCNLFPLFTSSVNVRTNPARQQSGHKTETEREWEGRRKRDEERCNGVRECKTEGSCDPHRPVISLRTKDWSAVF